MQLKVSTEPQSSDIDGALISSLNVFYEMLLLVSTISLNSPIHSRSENLRNLGSYQKKI